MSEFWLSQAWLVERIGWGLVHSAWQLAVVGVLSWLAASAQRRSAASRRYTILLCGLITMLVLPVFTAMVLRDEIPKEAVSSTSLLEESQAHGIEFATGDLPSVAPLQAREIGGEVLISDNMTIRQQPDFTVAQMPIAATPGVLEKTDGIEIQSIVQPWLPTIVECWMVGLLLFALRPLIGWGIVQQLRRRGTMPVTNEISEVFAGIAAKFRLASHVRLMQSVLVTAPVVVGWTRPVILLPIAAVNGLSLSQLEAVLAHELAHVRRFDSFVVVLQTLFEAVFFFHPIAWWISNQIRREREYCCDDLAVAMLNNRTEYGRALLAVSELKGSHGLFVLGADGGSLMFRVQRLFGTVDAVRNPMWASGTVIVALLAIMSLWFARDSKTAIASIEPAAPIEDPQSTDDGEPVLILRGKAVMPDGSIAKDAIIEYVGSYDGTDVKAATIKDGRFAIRATGRQLNAPTTLISTPDGSHMAMVVTHRHALRSDCNTERVVALNPAKMISVKVTREGQLALNAKVQIRAYMVDFSGTTNSEGFARIPIPQTYNVYNIVAWTEDRWLGGIIADRVPTMDSSTSSFEVEVLKPEEIRLRVVDQSLKPIPNLPLRFFEMSGEHFQYTVGTAPFSHQTTDASGEATFDLPVRVDKGGNINRYVDLPASSGWSGSDDITESDDGTLLLHLKPKRKRVAVRASLTGNTAGRSGLLVELQSFQGEQASMSDGLYARTDETGSFHVDVLPGGTYRAFVNDQEFVSNIWHGQIVDANTSRTLAPELRIVQGVTVNVRVTKGKAHVPVADSEILFETPYNYDYEKTDGSTGHGSSGRRFWGRTDENGLCTCNVIPGQLEIRVSESEWRETKTVTIPESGPVAVEMHWPYADKLTLNGKLKLPEGESESLDGTDLRIIAIDNDAKHEVTAVGDADGNFTAEIAAGRIALVAKTPSDQFFGCTFENLTAERIDVPLFRTTTYRGRVLGEDDAPQDDVDISMTVRRTDRGVPYPEDAPDFQKRYIDVFRKTVRPDGHGYFEFPGTPLNMELSIRVRRRGEEDSAWYGKRWIEPGENRAPEIIRIGSATPAAQPPNPLETVMADTLRDCRLSHTHALVAVIGSGDAVIPFVTKSIFRTHEVYSYLTTRIDEPQARELADRRKFFEAHNWPFPSENSIFLTALDPAGLELGRLTISINDEAAPAQVLEFVKKHAPTTQNARELFEAALAEAKYSNRRVWACVSQTRCAPCFTLARWMDSQRSLLEKDYVFFKFDDVRDTHGIELAGSLGFSSHGVPCHAILDADGNELANSISPLGNIGGPDASPEFANHLRKMLNASRQRLTDDEIDSIVLSLPTE